MAARKHPPICSVYLLGSDGGFGSPPWTLLSQPWQWDGLPQHHGRPHSGYAAPYFFSIYSLVII